MVLSKKFKKLAAARPVEKKIPVKEGDSNLPNLSVEENQDAFEEGQLSVDVFQTPTEIVVVAPVAGVKKQDIQVTLTDEVLTIRGKRNFVYEIERDHYFTRECFWGNFTRSIILPESIDTSKVKATFKEGIVTVRIPKVEKIRTRTIEIREE